MHVRRALALAVVAPLLLAGCTGDPEPTPKIPETSSATPTEEPTDTETPEAESAEDFIRRWVEINTEMQNSGDTAAYVEISQKCTPCNATADRVNEIYAGGGYVRTDGWIVRKVSDRSGGGPRPVFDLSIDSSPTEYRETPNGEVQSLPGGRLVMRVRLTKTEPWQVVQLTQVAQ